MKTLFISLLMVAAAGIGLAVGFALRGKPGSGSAESLAVNSASPADPKSQVMHGFNSRIQVRGSDDSPLATKLEHDLSMSSGVTRWLYWLEAIEKAQPADFPRLARLAQGNPMALRLVAQRWAELHPRHLFDTVVAATKNGNGTASYELTRALFDEWPKRNPEAAIAALNGSDDFGFRANWRMSVATTVFDQDVERGLRLMSEWHIENYGPRMTAVSKWAAADPRHAAEFTLENAVGYAARLTMETIGQEWAKTDPAHALEFATSNPGELGSTLAVAALKGWAGRNLDAAAEWIAATGAQTRNRLSPAFVETWAKQDATSALTWCESNLSGSSLAQAIGGVLQGAAEKDVAGAAGLVTAMNPSQAREEAAVAVAKKWFPELASDEPVQPAAIAWLAGLDPASIRRVMAEAQWGWVTSDPQSMAAFLTSYSSEQIPASVYNTLAYEMVRKDPLETLEWASHLPANAGLSAGSEAFAVWRCAQPESAMKWLNNLPSGDPRRQPYFESAIRALAYDSRAAEELAAMTVTEQATARSVIGNMSLPEDRRTRLLDVLKPH